MREKKEENDSTIQGLTSRTPDIIEENEICRIDDPDCEACQ